MSASLTPPPQSATIPFREIPAQWQVPGSYAEIQPNYGQQGVTAWPAQVLIIGQAITGSPGALLVPTQIFRVSDATAFWGAGSMIEGMVAAFVAANPYTPLYAMAVADAAGAAKASGTFTIGGAWSQPGTLALYVAGQRVQVGVLTTDTPTTVATNAVAAANAVAPGSLALPAVASSALGVVTMTARNGGAEGNNILLEVSAEPGDYLPAGMTVVVAPMAGGATNPTLAAVINAITGIWYTDIVLPWQDAPNVAALAAELAARYGAMEVEDAEAYVTFSGTLASAQSAAIAANCKQMAAVTATSAPSPPWAISASLAAVASFQLTNDPARQIGDLPLPGIVGPRPVNRLTTEEMNLALLGGLSPLRVTQDGTTMLVRVVSTYLTDTQGVPDPFWHDIMTAKTMSRIRYDWNSYRKQVYPSNKLADNGSVAAQYDPTVATPQRLAASWAARYRLYMELGWVENAALATQAVFVRNATDPNRVDCSLPVQIIGNLMVTAAVLSFQLIG